MKEKHKISKKIKTISYQPKTFKNLKNIVDIKSAIKEHPKTFHNLYETIKRFLSR